MVNILVCVKEVLDVDQVKVDTGSGKPILQGVPKKVNDFDKNAIEAAIQLKEKHGGSISVLSVGPKDCVERIRETLAMGADKAFIIADESTTEVDALCVSSALAGAARKIGEYDLILCGEVSMDDYSGQVGPRIAALLNIPQLTYTKKVEIEGTDLKVERDLGDETSVEQSSLPAVVTVTQEINTPRLPKLMDIMKAKSKPVEYWTLGDVGSDIACNVSTQNVAAITGDRKQALFENADEAAYTAVIEAVQERLGGA